MSLLDLLHDARRLHQQGQPAGARVIYEKILKHHPTNRDAITGLAVIAGQLKDFKRALGFLDRAIELDPRDAAGHCNRGLALHELKDFKSAVASYDRAIELRANYSVAYYNRGNALRELGLAEAAVQSFDEAIAIQPGFSQAHHNRGLILQDLGDDDGALKSYEHAIAFNPEYTDAYYNRGVVLQKLGHWLAALSSYDCVIARDATHAAAYSNRGVIQSLLLQSTAALESFDRAIAIRPDFANAHFNRGNLLKDLKQYPASVASYERAIALGSDGVGLYGSRRHVKMQMCDWQHHDSESCALLERIERGEPASPPFHVLIMTDSAAVQCRAAKSWMRSQHVRHGPTTVIAKYPRHDKIRVGYFSADFHDHATAYLIAQLFEEHTPAFDITAFSFGPDRQDAMRSRIRSGNLEFLDVSRQSDRQIALLARNLEIDIAVDLKGLTQFGRPGIFACRAAPIQVSYLGYPGTMGAGFMDYLVADRILIPPDHQPHYLEKIIFMPHSYQVNDARRAIADVSLSREELGLPASGFVYCCFNNSFKITPRMFEVWMRILRRVDGSVLWLYQDNPIAAAHLRSEATRWGVNPARLVFAAFMPLPRHLARHRAADLFLDTLPCNAHTTASDALWAGLPVLTCTGESFASRVAASLLTALTLSELIMDSYQRYEELAVELATDPIRLSAIKRRLAYNRLTAPLFDTPRYTRHLETAYQVVYERHQADLPTEDIWVESAAPAG